MSNVTTKQGRIQMKETKMPYSFVANREVRFIPKGWQHPKDERGRYVPLLPNGYCAANELTEEDRNGVGEMPDTSRLRPQELEVVAYETTSEGTPISPPFPETPEGRVAMINWCVEYETTFGNFQADGETWAAILFGTGGLVQADGSVEFP